MGLTEAPFRLLPLHQDSEHVKFCAHPSRAVFVSCSFLALLNISLTGFQSQMSCGLVFMVKDPYAGDSNVGLGALAPWGGLYNCDIPPICGLLTGVLTIPRVCPSYSSHCDYVFCCGKSFLLAFRLFL